MKKKDLQTTIEKFWGEKESINQGNKDLTKTINVVLDQLDRGIIRICEKNNGEWVTHEWIKKAILMSFKVNDNSIFSSGISNSDFKISRMRASHARITGCCACSLRPVGQLSSEHFSSPALHLQRKASATASVSACVANPSTEARKQRALGGAKHTGLRRLRSA